MGNIKQRYNRRYLANNIPICNSHNIHDHKIQDAIGVADNIHSFNFSCTIYTNFINDNMGIYCTHSRRDSILVHKPNNEIGGTKWD